VLADRLQVGLVAAVLKRNSSSSLRQVRGTATWTYGRSASLKRTTHDTVLAATNQTKLMFGPQIKPNLCLGPHVGACTFSQSSSMWASPHTYIYQVPWAGNTSSIHSLVIDETHLHSLPILLHAVGQPPDELQVAQPPGGLTNPASNGALR
jgi:hypothetical protein